MTLYNIGTFETKNRQRNAGTYFDHQSGWVRNHDMR